jgi:acyl-CoA synthetase (AMP-forming)/AMP-acid ligase II/aryl carrier-like protein
MTIPRLLARQNPDAVALLAPGRAPVTYRELCRRVNQIVATLRARGIQRNDRVGVVLPNGPDMAVAFLGVASAATCAPLNPTYRPEEFEFYLSDLKAKAIVVEAGHESPVLGLPVIELTGDDSREADVEPSGVALVLHTSGTTARPKIVPLTHANLCTSARNIIASLALTETDRCLNVMPLFHIHGLVASLLATLGSGGSVVCAPGFLAPSFFDWLNEFQPTWYTAVPTMHQAVLARAEQNPKRPPLRLIRSCSAALPPQVMTQLEATFGAPVVEAYGMTEAAHQMTSNPLPPSTRKPGSVGIPAGVEVAIMDDAGGLLPPGQTGEVVIRGPNVMAGYENNPEANARAFTNGWFRTGDQGALDADGYLTLTGRLKEIINRGGEKISPREVDEVLLAHPVVAQAVTFAVPDARLGEDVGAAVVLRNGNKVTERELREFAARRLADFKVPRVVVFVDEIPKGPTGKLQRIGLAGKLGVHGSKPTGATGGTPVQQAPRNKVEQELAVMWAEVLKVERVGIHDNFLFLGGDSILATRLLARIRENTGVEVPWLAFFDQPTVAGLAALVDESSAELQRQLSEVEQLSDAEAERLLAGES